MVVLYCFTAVFLAYRLQTNIKQINVFTFLNLLLHIGSLDFFITRYQQYSNEILLVITHVLTFAILLIFDFSSKSVRVKYIRSYVVSKRWIYLYIILWIFRLIGLARGINFGTNSATLLEYSNYSNILGIVNNLGLFIFGLALIYFSRRLVLSLGLLECIYFLFTGSKAFFIFPMVMFLYNRSVLNGIKITAKSYMLIFLVVFLVPVGFNLAGKFRVQVITGDKIEFNDVAESVALPDEKAIRPIINRISTFYYFDQFLSYSIKNPSNEYSSGMHFSYVLFWFVPKAVWADKPRVSYGDWIGDNVYGWDYGQGVRSEAAATLWGDFFNVGRYLGVVIGLTSTLGLLFLVTNVVGSDLVKYLFVLCSFKRIVFFFEQNFNSVYVALIVSWIIVICLQKILLKKSV